MASPTEKEKEADQLVKKANKLVSPSLFDFRLKPDWENAAPLLERAGTIYKQYKLTEKALDAYERAATAQEKLGSVWHAAKHYETCADICKSQADFERVAIFYQRASDSYCSAGKGTTGAEALGRGARALEDQNSEQAIKMYLEALDLYETESKESMGTDTYRATISLMIRAKRYSEAAELLMRFALACDRSGATNSQCKAYLGAVVTHLYNEDAVAAWHAFQDALAVDVFSGSDEAFAADSLFLSYRSGSEDEVRKYVSEKTVFKQLDNQVARLALKLPTGKMKRMAKTVVEVMGGNEGEEGEEEDEENPM